MNPVTAFLASVAIDWHPSGLILEDFQNSMATTVINYLEYALQNHVFAALAAKIIASIIISYITHRTMRLIYIKITINM